MCYRSRFFLRSLYINLFFKKNLRNELDCGEVFFFFTVAKQFPFKINLRSWVCNEPKLTSIFEFYVKMFSVCSMGIGSEQIVA